MIRLPIGAALCTLALNQVAAAADLPVKAPAAPPVYSWTGFYAGLNAGYGWSDPPVSIVGLGGPPGPTGWDPYYPDPFRGRNFSRSGFIGGGQLGYNYQLNRIVFGVEGDFQGSDIKGSLDTSGPGPAFFASPYTLHYDQRLSWLGTIRGRLGYAATDRLLIYGTGGFAGGRVSATSNLTFPTAIVSYAGSASETKGGWAAGGGIEYAFGSNWSAKLEYLHYDLGTVSVIGDPAPPSPPFQTRTDFSVRGNIVRAGVNYRFF